MRMKKAHLRKEKSIAVCLTQFAKASIEGAREFEVLVEGDRGEVKQRLTKPESLSKCFAVGGNCIRW